MKEERRRTAKVLTPAALDVNVDQSLLDNDERLRL